MKKSIVFAALFAIIAGVSAQEMNVQTAISDSRNERYAYAKKNIDEALQHEKTKNEAKTWAWAGTIYEQIVQQMNNEEASKSVKKQLSQIKETEQELCNKGIEFYKKSYEIEQKAGTHEFSKINMDGLKNLCSFEAKYASEVYNSGTDYAKAAELWAKIVEDAEFARYTRLRDDAMYYQADCYRMLKQPEKELALYRALAKNDTKRPDVYIKIYASNKEAGDTNKALNALKKGVKMTANDTTNANTILKTTLASAYLQYNKTEEANKILQEMISNAGNNVTALNGVASIYAEQGDLANAEKYYNQSLAVNGNQLDGWRGLGNAYFTKALKEHKIADAIPVEEVEAYDNKMKEVFALYEKSITPFEKALQIKDTDFQSLQRLRAIYSMFNGRQDVDQATKDGYKTKFQQYDTKLKSIAK